MSVENRSFGRYELKEEIGRGGMATVYAAHDTQTNRIVAIKLLPQVYLHDPTFRKRFQREAETVAKLDHPNIVEVYEFGEENGQPYLVMRLMQGGKLTDKLSNGPLSLEEVLPIVREIAGALDAAHAQGVVHRDLKPDNVLFDQFGVPNLTDFGIAKLTESNATYTGVGSLGTPEYMSPEQIQGSHNIDHRSDIYALGVIIFEMLTGVRPYQANSGVGLMLQHVSEKIPQIRASNSNLPRFTQKVIEKALAKSPKDRYESATALYRDLAQLPNAGRKEKLSRRGFVAMLMTLLVLGGAGLYAAISSGILAQPSPPQVAVVPTVTKTPIPLPTATQPPVPTSTIAQPEQLASIPTSTALLPTQTSTPEPTIELTEAPTIEPTPLQPIITNQNVQLLAPSRYASSTARLPSYEKLSEGTDQIISPDRQFRFRYGPSGGDIFRLSDNTLVAEVYYYFEEFTRINKLAWSSDGAHIAIAGGANGAGDILIIDAATGEPLRWLAGHISSRARGTFYEAIDLSWSSDGTRLVSIGEDGAIRVWDVTVMDERLNQQQLVIPVKGGQSSDIGWSNGNDMIISAESDNVLRVYSALTGDLLTQINDVYNSRTAFKIKNDGTSLTISTSSTDSYIWEVREERSEVMTPATIQQDLKLIANVGEGFTQNIAFSPNGELLAVITTHGIYLYKTEDYQLANKIESTEEFDQLVFSPDSSSLIASNRYHGTLHIWDVTSGELLNKLTAHPDPLTSLQFSPNGENLATASTFGTTLWTWPNLTVFRSFNAEMGLVSYARNAPTAAIRTYGHTPSNQNKTMVIVKEVIDNKLVSGGVEIDVQPEAMVMSPNGQFLVTSTKTELSFWNTSEGRLIESVSSTSKQETYTDILFSDDGTLQAGSTAVGEVILRGPVQNFAIRDIIQLDDNNEIFDLAISPDGTQLAMSTRFSNVLIWQIDNE